MDTGDLGPVPDLLRAILEETLSQEASQQSLDRFLPRIRDIIINLLHGLKRKQQRLRQRSGRDGTTGGGSGGGSGTRQGSLGSVEDGLDGPSRAASRADTAERPPRTTSIPGGGRESPRFAPDRQKEQNLNRNTTSSRGTLSDTSSSLSSNTMQNIPVVAPYPQEETMPTPQEPPPPPAYTEETFPHPPPPPPKQTDALAALQRGGELERRASRRFSAYQIQKHLGSNGIPMLPPTQNSPIPNRGRDVRESMNAVRARGSVLHGRQKSSQRINTESPSRKHDVSRISEEGSESKETPTVKPPPEPIPDDSPIAKTPEDKLGPQFPVEMDAGVSATSGPIDVPAETVDQPEKGSIRRRADGIPSRHASRKAKSPTPQQEFVPEQSPQPGKELTLFLQYKSKVKKFVLADGYNELSVARLQLAFIEKFAWNTHNDGVDLPEIYVQDPVSGVRHELEDLSDIKDRSVLVLNVEALDEVKRHIDDGLGGLRKAMESIKTSLADQQSSLRLVSDRQQQAAKEIAGIATAPSLSARASTVITPKDANLASAATNNASLSPKDSAAQLNEIQTLRRDLAVCRQVYSSFVADMNASMEAVRTKAASVKAVAFEASTANLAGATGRAYVDRGKKSLGDDSEKVLNRIEDLQDIIEDLRKDVVTRGVRPVPRQLEEVEKELKGATAELKRMQDTLKREKPLWTRVWEQELQVVCEERDQITYQEELAADLESDLERARETFELVEQATRQQQQDLAAQGVNGDTRGVGSRNASRNLQAVAMDRAVDPRQAKDGVLGEVRALQPNHEGRLEAIERAEKLRQRELESRKEGTFKKELGSFVEEGKLKRTGGAEEVERLRRAKDDRIRREVWERMNGPVPASGTENVPPEQPNGDGAAPDEPPKDDSESTEDKFVDSKEEVTPPEEAA